MADLRRSIGVFQIVFGILLLFAVVYFSNYIALEHITFTENAAADFAAAERLGVLKEQQVPEYATMHANYILLSNLNILLLVNFGVSSILSVIAIIMILQGVVNKYTMPRSGVGYKVWLWIALSTLVVFFCLLLIMNLVVR